MLSRHLPVPRKAIGAEPRLAVQSPPHGHSAVLIAPSAACKPVEGLTRLMLLAFRHMLVLTPFASVHNVSYPSESP